MGYWEIASLILQVVQMGYYLNAVDNYKDKLEDLGQWLCDTADAEAAVYESFRDCDPDFYEYYTSLPSYEECNSAVNRSKGAAFASYGANLRRRVSSVRGYTPLAKVHWNNLVSDGAVAESSVTRVVNKIRERKRVHSHTLERWSAIVSAPVAVEAYRPSIVNGITQQSFRSLKGAARGFNSAGTAFGNTLFQVLN